MTPKTKDPELTEAMLPSDNRGAVCIKAWTEYEPAENPRLTDAQRQRHAFFNGFEAAWNTRPTSDKDARIAELEAGVELLREAYRKNYLDHMGLCNSYDAGECSCGFDEFFSRAFQDASQALKGVSK